MRDLDCEKHDQLFDCRRSVRYHIRRRRFFESLHTFTSTITVLFGSATFFSILSQDELETYALGAAATITFFSTVDLVVGTARKARLHEDLGRRFIALEKDMVTGPEDWSEKVCRKFRAARLEIEAEEPPINRVVDSLAHNELMVSMGYPDEQLVTIRWYQRWFGSFFPLFAHRIGRKQPPPEN